MIIHNLKQSIYIHIILHTEGVKVVNHKIDIGFLTSADFIPNKILKLEYMYSYSHFTCTRVYV